jgi:heat shock protein HtpX
MPLATAAARRYDRSMRRRELFPADRGLQARMVATAVLTPTAVVAALVACAFLLPHKVFGGLVVAGAAGAIMALRERNRLDRGHILRRDERPELHAMVERLCVVADLEPPDIAVDREPQPNSWIVDAPGRRPRLHLTSGLLRLLDEAELEAVVAHELSHVVHRDATVMTVVGMPGAVLAEGGGRLGRQFWILQFGGLLALAIGRVAALGTRALSRYRELTADAGAAALTGRPSALASALMKVSGELGRIPAADLRAVSGRDAFHLLPTDRESGRWSRTHPTLERRLAALERIERDLQRARLT